MQRGDHNRTDEGDGGGAKQTAHRHRSQRRDRGISSGVVDQAVQRSPAWRSPGPRGGSPADIARRRCSRNRRCAGSSGTSWPRLPGPEALPNRTHSLTSRQRGASQRVAAARCRHDASGAIVERNQRCDARLPCRLAVSALAARCRNSSRRWRIEAATASGGMPIRDSRASESRSEASMVSGTTSVAPSSMEASGLLGVAGARHDAEAGSERRAP